MSSLQNATLIDHDPHLLPCKNKARKYTPPGGNYAEVYDGQELLDIVLAPGRGERLIRVSDELLYMDIPEPFMVPEGINATIDCQGAVLDFKPLPSGYVAAADSAMNLYDCCGIGWSVGKNTAKAGVFVDVTLKTACETEENSASFFHQFVIQNGTAGLHYEDEEILGGVYAWRNFTAGCADIQELDTEVAKLKEMQEVSAIPMSSIGNETRSNGDGAPVALWVISVVAVCGATLFLCFVGFFVFTCRRKGVEWSDSTNSRDTLRDEKESTLSKKEALLSSQHSSAKSSYTHAQQRGQTYSSNSTYNSNSNNDSTISSSSAAPLGWNAQLGMKPGKSNAEAGGIRKLPHEYPSVLPISGSSAEHPLAPLSGRRIGHVFAPRLESTHSTDIGAVKHQIWNINPTAAPSASGTLSDSAGLAGWIHAATPAQPASGNRSASAGGATKPIQINAASVSGIGGGESVNVGGASTCAHCKLSSPLAQDALDPPNRHYAAKPPAAVSTTVSKKRNKKQHAALELELSRVDSGSGGSQYRRAVQFLGTSSRQENPHLAHLRSSRSSAPLRGQNAVVGVDSVNSGSRGTSPSVRQSHVLYSTPKIASQSNIDSDISES